MKVKGKNRCVERVRGMRPTLLVGSYESRTRGGGTGEKRDYNLNVSYGRDYRLTRGAKMSASTGDPFKGGVRVKNGFHYVSGMIRILAKQGECRGFRRVLYGRCETERGKNGF